MVVTPDIRGVTERRRDAAYALDESIGLARAVQLVIVHAEIATAKKPRPSTLFGSGTVDRLKAIAKGEGHSGGHIEVAVIDAQLTPVQQRNLEKAWDCKVIDRTGLILEIFGARARTREGRLQVDLAALSYQRSRLVRSWTHLERQRGGAGFMGGPGERQIETDRRLIDQRITRLRRELKEVARTRTLHRDARKRVPYPVIALVGYTNAGKSTLFNRLTEAQVVARDQLFATLDPTMRGLKLGSGRMGILSDTVGFVSNLPHELVNAFHATLEEVVEADLIVHVRDAAHPETEEQRSDVLDVLAEMGIGNSDAPVLIEVLNKIDLLTTEDKTMLGNRALRSEGRMVPVSAETGDGCAELISAIDGWLTAAFKTLDVSLDHGDGATLAWFYERGIVVSRHDGEDAIHLTVRLDHADAQRFKTRP